ncbi:MFS transporter [Amycolatopsis tolypomycina]|uniref:MFS transporter n=1 Tax=Amycolatopsis tolypomycina TaxID=208445 RepID=UPI0033B18A63
MLRLALVVVAGALVPLVDTTVVTVVLPATSADVHAGPAAIPWGTTAYLLALAVTVPVTAWASDRFGTKRLWIAGLALFLLPLFFQQQRGLTALTAGAVLALQGVGSLLTRWTGGVVDRIGARPIATAGVVLCAAATVPFAVAGARTGWVLLGGALVVRGGALSAVNIAITAGAFRGLARDEVPRSSGSSSSSAAPRAPRCSPASRPRPASTARSSGASA